MALYLRKLRERALGNSPRVPELLNGDILHPDQRTPPVATCSANPQHWAPCPGPRGHLKSITIVRRKPAWPQLLNNSMMFGESAQISSPSVDLAISEMWFGLVLSEFEEVTENLKFHPTGLIFFFFWPAHFCLFKREFVI